MGSAELFSWSVENRFVFSLFELLLCGVILLVLLRGWADEAAPLPSPKRWTLFLAFLAFGGAFLVQASASGAALFSIQGPSGRWADAWSLALQALGWAVLQRTFTSRVEPADLHPGIWLGGGAVLLVAGGLILVRYFTGGLHFLLLLNMVAAGRALIAVWRRPLGGSHLGTLSAALLILGTASRASLMWFPGAWEAWILEQTAWVAGLLVFALAVGEASQDLFDRVFVRLQTAFILLAGVMILGIIQAGKNEFQAGLRSRIGHLASFVQAHVEFFRKRNEPLASTLEREEFLQRLALGFGSFQELKVVRVVSGGESEVFEILGDGRIQRTVMGPERDGPAALNPPEAYFTIHSVPVQGQQPGSVDFLGSRAFLMGHIRNRIVLVFSLFTGMVALSTLMIGLVVQRAAEQIRSQSQEIETAERRLRQASKLAAIGELSAGVAHEINNPAAVILSRASFMLSGDGASFSASDREDLDAIVAQAHRIAHITESLLLFARTPELKVRPLEVDRLMTESLASVAGALRSSGVRIDWKVPPGLPRILGDKDSLGRALENLYRNALDAMNAGGTLTLRAFVERSAALEVGLEVGDTGPGIQAGDLERIWEPFFTTKDVGKGTGLGLSIVHGIIREHGGMVRVHSHPGAGSTFTLVLPGQV